MEPLEGNILDRVSIFNILSAEEKVILSDRMENIQYRMGQTICRRGDESVAFYLIIHGRARVVGQNAAGEEISIGVLNLGDHFGEEYFLGDTTVDFTVRAASNLTLMKLGKRDFLDLLEKRPELERYFKDYLSDAAMRAFLKRSTILAPMGNDELRSLLDRITVCDYEPGADIVREGEEGDSFFIIRSGTVVVTKNKMTLNRLQAGDFFGELALLTGAPRAATVRAQDRVTVYRLSRADFDHLIQQFPKIKDAILSITSGYSSQVAEDSRMTEMDWDTMSSGLSAGQEENWEPVEDGENSFSFRSRRRYRFPVMLQQSQSDCGAACLAMVARYYGKKISINRLRDLANVSRDGATLYSLAEAAETLGFNARGVQMDFSAFTETRLPVIAHWQGNHYVVVYRVTKERVIVADPGVGLLKLSVAEFRQGWTGTSLLLTPTETFTRVEESKTTLGRFLPYLKPHRRALGEIFLASLVIQLFGLGIPLFTQTVVDRVLVYRSGELLNLLLWGMLLVTFFNMVITVIRQYLVAYTVRSFDITLVTDFFKHLFSLPLKFFAQRRIGDIIIRINENQKIRSLLTTTTLGAVLDVLTVIVYLLLMFFYSSKLTWVAILFLPFFIGIALLFTPVMKRNSRQVFQANADFQSFIVETISAVATVKALTVEQIIRWRLEEKLQTSTKLQMKGAMIGVAAEAAGTALNLLSRIIILWYGATLTLAGEMTVGQLMAFSVLLGSITGPVLRTIGLWDQIQEVRISLERLNDVFEAEPEEKTPEHSIKPLQFKAHVKLSKVTFRYEPEGKNVLQNVDLEIFPGQTVAFVGRSGAGKTTLAHLLLKLYQPSTGKITIDGYDLRQLNTAWLRRQIGVVQQDNALFNGTIRDNIAFHQPDAPFHEIVSAAMLAGAHDFISDLPMGYETVVGERGMSLSGGQRQRLAIARTLLGKPRLLIFDEATSALDTESERMIQNNLESILKDRTTIIIAHRLSTVRRADLIVVLDRGMVVETGTHEELMAAKGLYYYLNNQQISQ